MQNPIKFGWRYWQGRPLYQPTASDIIADLNADTHYQTLQIMLENEAIRQETLEIIQRTDKMIEKINN